MSTNARSEPFEVHYDGLRDEQGLIPAFGPVRLDEQGRIVMSEEERKARSEAAIRMLKVIGRLMPDEDTPEADEAFLRAIDRHRA
jgi:hypothetical protein